MGIYIAHGIDKDRCKGKHLSIRDRAMSLGLQAF